MLRIGARQIRASKSGRLPPQLDALVTKHNVGWTGRAFLVSILNARGDHRYADTRSLIASLLMRDHLAAAARVVNDKVDFAGAGKDKLDRKFWRMRPGRRFECRGSNYAASVKATLLDKERNALECAGLTDMIALYALLLAMKGKWFDQSLNARLSLNRLSICRLPGELIEHELLGYVPVPSMKDTDSSGAKLFRPGDLMAFNCLMNETADTQWKVENAICVGWKRTSTGQPDYDTPLFVGGGVAGAKTEPEMKFMVFDNVRTVWTAKVVQRGVFTDGTTRRSGTRQELERLCADHFTSTYGTDAQMKTSFAVKVLKTPKWESPIVKLNPAVSRIGVLGGRVDLPGQIKKGP